MNRVQTKVVGLVAPGFRRRGHIIWTYGHKDKVLRIGADVVPSGALLSPVTCHQTVRLYCL